MKIVECFKQGLMDHKRKVTEDRGAESNVSEEKNVIKYPRDNSWYILAKNVAEFFSLP